MTKTEGGETKTEFEEVTHKGKHKVIEYSVPVFSFPGGLANPGQYTFPFSFYLPGDLPASVCFTANDKSYAMVKYSIKAVLEPGFGLDLKAMKHK